MSNYRISRIVRALSATTASVSAGEYPRSGSAEIIYKNVWGILIASGSTGYVSMSYGGAIDISHLAPGVDVPCIPSFVSCSSGTVYILA